MKTDIEKKNNKKVAKEIIKSATIVIFNTLFGSFYDIKKSLDEL